MGMETRYLFAVVVVVVVVELIYIFVLCDRLSFSPNLAFSSIKFVEQSVIFQFSVFCHEPEYYR